MKSRKRIRSWFRDRVEWPLVGLAVRLLLWALRLSPYCLVWILARVCGWVAWRAPQVRRLVRANVAAAFPELSADIVGRASLTHLSATFLESFWLSGRPEKLAERVDIGDSAERLLAYLAEAPCVLISPHLGNWELGHQRLAQQGVPVSCVAQQQRNPALERIFHGLRSQYGGAVIHDKGAVKGILSALKNGRLVEMLIDQNTSAGKGGVFVPFFGLPALTSRAPAVLLRRTKLRIFVGFVRRLPNGRFQGQFRPLDKITADFASDEDLLREISRITEECVRECPEQYLWLYKKWRHVPKDAPPELAQKFPYYARKSGIVWSGCPNDAER